MKKILLLATAAVLAAGASAQDLTAQPETMVNKVIEKVSPDGNWAINKDPYTGLFEIINFATGDSWEMMPDETVSDSQFDAGSGNAISNTGVIVLTTTYLGDASYWEGGEIKRLPVAEGDNSSFSQGITPDGSRICGNVGMEMSLNATSIMQLPVVWDRNDDGTYGQYVALPHPELDWTGRIPQYIQAICISDDGKTIVGQMVDYMGAIIQPIMWKEDAAGNWTYTMVGADLINPNHVEFPPYEECPEEPSFNDYMTPEELAAYQEAVASWDWTSGQEYPQPADYMTPEERAAYEAAMAEYQTALDAWNAFYYDYSLLLEQAIADSKAFNMNSVFLSGNGRYYATHHYVGFMWTIEACTPFVFDLETGAYYSYEEPQDHLLIPTYINDNGVLLCANPANTYCRNTFISPAPGQALVSLASYIQPIAPETYAWITENCVHDMPSYDPETGEPIVIPDQMCTGTASADARLTKIYSWVANEWNMESDEQFYSYIIPMPEGLGSIGQTAVESKAVNVSTRRGGVITLSGEAADLKVFDMQGRMVFSRTAPAGEMATGLSSGIYTIVVKGTDGKPAVLKAVF